MLQIKDKQITLCLFLRPLKSQAILTRTEFVLITLASVLSKVNQLNLSGFIRHVTTFFDYIAPGGKRIKTRSGDTIRLKDLIDEGLERAEAKLKEKGRDKELTKEEFERAKKAVAIGCIKYSDLATDRIKDYEFSFDRMLDDRGNTAVYLLYCLARTRSIIRKANLDKPIDELIKTTDTLKLSHIRELRLAKNLLKFPEIILNVSDTLKPHELCGYLFDLSVVFSEFYEECYCIEKLRVNDEDVLRVNFDRLLLCEATARIISLGLTLMGIELVEKL